MPATTHPIRESGATIDLDFSDTVTLSNCGDKISGVIERLTALAVEKPGTVPTDLLATCIDVAAVAIAVQMAEHKAVRESEDFKTFRPIVEGDLFRKAGEGESSPREMFRSNTQRPTSADGDWRPGQVSEAASATEYDFSTPGSFAARYR